MRRAPAYPLLRLVSEASPMASERFDFNDGDSWTVAGIDFGSPPVLGAPDSVNSEYDYRQVSFRVNMVGSENEVYARCEQLARELMRDTNYLMFQLSAVTPPRWLQLLRSPLGSVVPVKVKRDDDVQMWTLPLTLIAEPFALGEQVTETITVYNDPAVTDGLAVVLPEIKGDAPAPLMIYDESDLNHGWTLAALTTWAPIVAQFAATSGDATMSGGNYTRQPLTTTFGTVLNVIPALTDEIRENLANESRVRVLVAVRRGTGSTGFLLRAVTTLDSSARTVSIPASWDGARTLVDLGTLTLATAAPGYRVDSLPAVEIQASTDSGTADLDFDVLLLVPLGQALTLTGATVGGLAHLFVNGEEGWAARASDGPDFSTLSVWATEKARSPRGVFLEGRPGESNVLTWQTGSDDLGRADVGEVPVGNVSVLYVSYHPRHLWLPGS